MRTDSDLLRTERILWRGATTTAIAILLLMMLQTRLEHRDTTTPRFDEPGAAACVCSPLASTAIAFDPLDDNVLYAPYGNFGRAHVFRSIDNGETWMVSIDAGLTWMTEETGFGPAVTMWLSLIRTPAGQQQLFAFTHGRGAWRARNCMLDSIAP